MQEIECTRGFIARCVVILCVQVGWFVGGGNKCNFCWETEGFVWKLSDSCEILCMSSSRYVCLREM